MEQPILISGFDIRLLGFYASVLGTLATVAIAAFAGWIAYLQAHGKKPILILQSIVMNANKAPPGFVRVVIIHQFWNRRAFAVRIGSHRLAFDNNVIRRAPDAEQSYLMSERHVTAPAKSEIVEAGKPLLLTSEFLIKVGAIEDVIEPYTVRLDAFEPMGWRRRKKLRSREVFHPAREFDRSLKTRLRIFFAKFWIPKERSNEWISESGQLREADEVFNVWKNHFNSRIGRREMG